MKFVGHLDIMRYFQKAMRRAEVDIAYSEGFSPHQKMSFAAPLGLGLTSEGEYMDIEVHQSKSSKEMVQALNAVCGNRKRWKPAGKNSGSRHCFMSTCSMSFSVSGKN